MGKCLLFSRMVYRIIRKVPELVESFIDRAAALLNDRNHSVILAGVSLMLQVPGWNSPYPHGYLAILIQFFPIDALSLFKHS